MQPFNWKSKVRNRRGFTLIEVVIALGIFVLLQLTLAQVVSAGGRYYHELSTGRLDDWGGFVLQLQRETRMGTLKKSTNRSFVVEQPNGDWVTYEFYQNKKVGMIRRRVNHEGHQPALIGVERCTIQQESPRLLTVNCHFDNQLEQSFTFQFQMNEPREEGKHE